MKRIVCEMCGSTDLIKEDGVFVCQNCGTKYSIEEAKKMMVEFEGPIEVKGTVEIKKDFDTIAKMADEAYANGNYKEAYDYYTQYIEKHPDDYERKLNRNKSYAWGLKIHEKNHVDPLINYVDEYAKCVLNDDSVDEKMKATKIYNAFCDAFSVLVSIFNLGRSIYVDNGVSSSVSHNNFLDTVTFVVTRQFLLLKQSEKYFVIEPTFENIWTQQCKNVDVEIEMYSRKYRWYDNTFYLNSVGKERYRSMKDANNSNRSKISTLKENALKEKARIEREKQDAKNKAYWEENKALFTKLTKEKDELLSKIEKIKSKVSNNEEEISKIKNENPFDSNAFDKKANELSNELRKNKTELASLGLFKIKEKKELRSKIELLETDLNKNETEKQKALEIHDANISKLYEKQTNNISSFNEEISTLEKHVSEITEELERDY